MVTTRKIEHLKAGGRSGVVINKIDDSNVDLDGWFDSAQSPEVESKQNVASSSKEENWDDDDGSLRMKVSRKKTVKTPKHQLNMTLSGAAKEDDREDERDSTSVKKYVSKLRRKDRAQFTSPSDLSRVSTAPFSPHSEERNEGEDMGNIQTDAKSNDADDSETENALMTQENNKETDLNGEQGFIAHQSTDSANLKVASPEVDFPADEDDGDDLGPPVLPQDFSNDEEPTQGQPSETKKANDNNIGGLYSEDEKIDSGSVGNNNVYDDDDGEDEGPGFHMVHDPETPLTVREDRVKKEIEKIRQERKNQNKKNGLESESDDNNDDDDDDDDDEDSKSIPVKRSEKHRKKKNRTVIFSPKGIPIANRDYETVPVGALVEGSSDESGPRRSRRAKVQPLQFWRGEKMQFGAHNEHGYIGKAFGDMPVVTGIQKALPTPYKKRKQTKKKPDQNKSSRKNYSSDTRGSVAEEEFNSKKLRRKYKFHDGEEAYLWDDITEDTADQKVVAYASNMEGSGLPISKKRKKAEGKVTGKAAQAFNISSDGNDDYVGYIVGNLLLPPKGIKDSESVGPCAQTFTVCRSQPKALEIAFGDPDQPDGELDAETSQRFLLGPSDMFRVPPGNSYRLENHSEDTECLLTWTIIRPRSVPTVPS